jgi:hypothetical protein
MKGNRLIIRIFLNVILVALIMQKAAFAQTDLIQSDPERASAAVILEQPANDPRVQNRQHELVPTLATSADGKQIFLAWYTGGKGRGQAIM